MTENPETPIEIPMENLSDEILMGVIQEFILREGTDYGAAEVPLEKKIQQVFNQIQSRDVRIFFDATSETVTLVPRGKEQVSLEAEGVK